MAIWKRAGSALCGAVAVAAVVGLSAANAMAMPAATTLTAKVTGGGSITATAGKTTLTDGKVSVTCKSSKSTGSIANGTHKGSAPLKVGTAKTLSFKSCTGPLGTVSNSPSGFPYAISVNGPTKSGNTAGTIGPVTVAVSTAGCTFTVTGSAPGYYNSTKHELILTPKLPKGLKALTTAKLTIGDVSGCPGGIIADGQHPTFSTTYKVSKKVKITVTG
jgi:hypothetical protein